MNDEETIVSHATKLQLDSAVAALCQEERETPKLRISRTAEALAWKAWRESSVL